MSHSHEHHGHDHHADHHDDGSHDGTRYHASLGGYVIGFVLSVILTVIPFWLVMGKVIDSSATTAAVVLAFAAAQIVVHVVYFLHMDSKSEDGWNMIAMVFTIFLLVILIAGSMWVMHNMNVNMMPHAHEAAPAAGMSHEGHDMPEGHVMPEGHEMPEGHDMENMK